MKQSQITIKDIARELKISPSTVSRALKDHPDISPATKLAVKELAERLDYQPNIVALSLRKSRTFTIGVVIPQIVHHFFSTVISGIEDVANEAGYHVMICQSNESYDREVTSVQTLVSSRVDGLLVSVAQETDNPKHFESVVSRGIPLVFFDRVMNGVNTSFVVVDDFEGAYKATVHLIKSGCRKIAHLAGPENLVISQSRKRGFLKALDDYNIPVNDTYIIPAGLTIEQGMKACNELLALGDRPDAIFASNDPLAIGALKATKKAGLSIPDDISIVGFSDEPITSLLEPSLTTVAQPGYQMGQLAAQMLLHQIDVKDKSEDSFAVETKELKTKLIVRESTK